MCGGQPPGLEGSNYGEEMDTLSGFFPLGLEAEGDLKEFYNIIKSIGRIDNQNLFPLRMNYIRNTLPEDVVKSDAIITCRRHLNSYLNRQGVEGYRPNAEKLE